MRYERDCIRTDTRSVLPVPHIEKELRELQANGEHGEKELPDETELPDGTELPTRMGSVVRPAYNQSGGVCFFRAI